MSLIHNPNLQILATEMYKIKNDLSPLIVTELFKQRNEKHHDLSNNSHFTIPTIRTVYHGSERPTIRTVYHGSESISFLEPTIWNIFQKD